MEYAEYIRNLEDLNEIASNTTRIYFGSDFCDRLVPEILQFEDTYKKVKELGLNITFTTPFLTVDGLNKICILIDSFIKNDFDIEIVINDFGLLRFLKSKNYLENTRIKPVLGRLLSRQKTDIMTKHLKDKVLPDVYEHFCTPVAASIIYYNLLKEYNIDRIEVENVPNEIMINDKIRDKIAFSLVYPWVSVSSTRLCPTSMYFGDRSNLSVQKCKKECLNNYFSLADEIYGKFYCKGNTLFYKNEVLPAGIDTLGINRIVNESHR